MNAPTRKVYLGTGDKVGPVLVIKPLTECSVGELIRLTSGAWAIVAKELDARTIFVVSGDHAPFTCDLPEDSTSSCISYGIGFRVASVRASFIGMHTYGQAGFDSIGKLIVCRPFEKAGRVGRYFAAPADPTRFLDLDSFQVVSEPRGYRALFGDWEVSINRPGQPEIAPLVKSSLR
jgi:hypothetical protein